MVSLCPQPPAEFAGEGERRRRHHHLAQDDRGEDGAALPGGVRALLPQRVPGGKAGVGAVRVLLARYAAVVGF